MVFRVRISLVGQIILILMLMGEMPGAGAVQAANQLATQIGAGETVRVSVASGDVEALNGDSTSAAVSADGRYVAFSSDATNLVSDDTNGISDIFVHDTQSDVTTRVSVATNGGQANSYSYGPSISADGRFIAFESYATNLAANDTNGRYDVFVHDMQTGITTCISLDINGVPANDQSASPAISADGRYVAFDSFARNLIAGDTNNNSDVFVRDTQTGTIERISVNSSEIQANSSSMQPSISADGQSIAFSSYATNLVTGDTNGKQDVFVRDRHTGTTLRTAVEAAQSSISADGRYVVFDSSATNLVSGDTNGTRDVFVYDRQTDTTERASVDSSGGQANGMSEIEGNSFLSADGRYVTFSSQASNLVHGDVNGATDIFVHDLQTGLTNRVSVSSNGAQGNSSSLDPAISADGQFVTFYSFALNLITDDENYQTDVFVHRQNIYPVTPAISGNVGVAGAALNYMEDGFPKAVISDHFGNYVIPVPEGWSGTVIPSKENVTFTPDSRSYEAAQASQAAQNYTATVTVVSLNDSGSGSLRQAVADAASGTTIRFDPLLAGRTIMLVSDLSIDQDIMINGSGLSPQLTISADSTSRRLMTQFDTNVTISDLTVTNTGGVRAYEGDLKIINSTLKNNFGPWGGAVYSHGPSLIIENSTIANNRAGAEGGAIYLVGPGNARITNSTVTQNWANQKGGGIILRGNVTAEIRNSTFAENSAPVGSEISIMQDTSHLTLFNALFVCAPASTNCYDYLPSSVASTNSILDVGTLAEFGLGMLSPNGGPTQTMALLPGSPGIDAGDDLTCLATDQRGITRPQGAGCDMGAYEFQPVSTIRYVKWNTTGANNGTSWLNAYTDLQSALAAASSGDEIWVAAGTYKPTSTSDRSISFNLKNGVAIYGGFAGNETARDQRNYQTNLTVLSGDIGAEGNNSDNSYHVLVGSNTDNSAILDGFTITAGNANDVSSPYRSGGGMYIEKGAPRLNGLIFAENHAGFGGGLYTSHTGVDNPVADLILTHVVFRDNTATVEGGGLALGAAPPPSSTVHLSLTDVVFENNTAARTGGGLINNGGELELLDVTFLGNTALGGGGMSHISFGPSTLTNVTFSNNDASEAGGGMLVGSSGPTLTTLTNVTFNNNSTALRGGGIANAGDSDLDLTNVTFSGNTAGENGGGLSNGILDIETSGTVNLIYTTFRNNTATSQDSAIYNQGGSLNIHNSILYGDTGHEIVNNAGTAAVTHSIVQGGYTGTGNLDVDPLLGPLQDNGGFTETMALGAGSPAIDAADDANCPATDPRGVTRPQGSHCDIGAYEYSGSESTVDVNIGTAEVGSYLFAPQESRRQSYPGINGGPVKLINTHGADILAAERVIYKVNGINTSFTEMMGLPASQLDTTYWLPWYNNVDLDTQLRIANVSGSQATVTVTIGGVTKPSFNLAAGESTRVSYPGVNNGPVKIISTQDIVAAERVIYQVKGVNTSFTEMMALPASQLGTTYWLPWYNNVDLDTQLRIANVSGSPATVTVTIGGIPQPSFNLAAGVSTRLSYPGVNNGPVKIESTQNIVAAERVIYKVKGINTSFSEMMAQPASQLNQTYWLPWYNNVDLDTQLRIANVSGSPATITVTIGGVPQPSFDLAAGESTRVSYPGVNNGLVKIVSTQNIVAAERVIYKVNGINTSFSEMMALPNNLLDTTFWFPWYNNVDLLTQLRFGVP